MTCRYCWYRSGCRQDAKKGALSAWSSGTCTRGRERGGGAEGEGGETAMAGGRHGYLAPQSELQRHGGHRQHHPSARRAPHPRPGSTSSTTTSTTSAGMCICRGVAVRGGGGGRRAAAAVGGGRGGVFRCVCRLRCLRRRGGRRVSPAAVASRSSGRRGGAGRRARGPAGHHHAPHRQLQTGCMEKEVKREQLNS